jgi:hypothetical protein
MGCPPACGKDTGYRQVYGGHGEGKETPAPIGEHNVLGIVFPIYAWSTPKYVTDFVKRIKVHKKAFVFAVATCESETGLAFAWLRPFVRIDSRYTVIMPNNYVVWGYGANNEAYHRNVIENARLALGPIGESIPPGA